MNKKEYEKSVKRYHRNKALLPYLDLLKRMKILKTPIPTHLLDPP